MGLGLICPHCQARVSLSAKACAGCGGDLRHLPPEQRHYFLGKVEPVSAPGPEVRPAAASVEEKREELIPDILSQATKLEDKEKESPVFITENRKPKTVNAIMGARLSLGTEGASPEMEHLTLCEALDRILNKGAVVVGEVMISVANVDLLYLGLQLVLTSVESLRETKTPVSDLLH